jgi:hypothetical protein
MREPPKLADQTIVAALHAHYGVSGKTLAFLPLGSDSASAVYHIRAADGAAYLLKARAGAGFSEPSLAVPHYLYTHGVPHILPHFSEESRRDAVCGFVNLFEAGNIVEIALGSEGEGM